MKQTWDFDLQLFGRMAGPPQWVVGSEWLGDGGVYPGMGDTIGLAGTSPERVAGGLWSTGGPVGDPPFDTGVEAEFEGQIGAGVGGGSGGSGGGSGVLHGGDLGDINLAAGAAAVGVATLGVYYLHHRFKWGASDGSIKATLEGILLIGVGAWAILPAIKAATTTIADATGWPILINMAAWGNAA